MRYIIIGICALLFGMLIACQTRPLIIINTQAPGAPAGIVEIHECREISYSAGTKITIVLANGSKLGPFSKQRHNEIIRIICPPGNHKIQSSKGFYNAEADIEVAENTVTVAGFKTEITDSSSYQVSLYGDKSSLEQDRSTGSTDRSIGKQWRSRDEYRAGLSIGRPLLPVTDKPADPALLAAALNADDWGTRYAGLDRVYWEVKPLPASLVEVLTNLVRNSPSGESSYAAVILDIKGHKVPFVTTYFEEFRLNPYHYWWTGNEPYGSASFTGRNYRLTSKTPGGFFSVREYPSLPGQGKCDFNIALVCVWEEGSHNSLFGLTLRTKDGRRYEFAVNKGGYARAENAGKGSLFEKNKDGYTIIGTIPEQQTARIELSRRKDIYTMTVNGIYAGSFTGKDDIIFDRIGVVVKGSQTVSFTRLSISTPYGIGY